MRCASGASSFQRIDQIGTEAFDPGRDFYYSVRTYVCAQCCWLCGFSRAGADPDLKRRWRTSCYGGDDLICRDFWGYDAASWFSSKCDYFRGYAQNACRYCGKSFLYRSDRRGGSNRWCHISCLLSERAERLCG